MRSSPLAVLVAVIALPAIAGCGGGGGESEASHASASSSSHPAPTSSSTAFTSAPPSGGGGGGGFGGGDGFSSGGGSGHSAHPHLGGIGGVLHDREARRRAATERAHRPPGPERLGAGDEQTQRTSDWVAASSSAHPVTSTDDDQCERLWAQHVASGEAYHTRRHDGLHPTSGAGAERRFLATCRAQTPVMQQCMDRTYLVDHQDECREAREHDPRLQQARHAAAASRDPVEF